MSTPIQDHLAEAAIEGAKALEAALDGLPEDKRSWSPMGGARTALDQVAECAIVTGSTADVMRSKTFPADFDWGLYIAQKAELAADQSRAVSLMHENTAKFAEAVRSLREEDMQAKIAMPWGEKTVAEIAAYPAWNFAYHLGQVNYIASMLGVLK